MARGSSFKLDAQLILQIVIGALLIVMGLKGINDYNSDLNEAIRSVSRFFGKEDNPFNLMVAIIQLACGIALLVFLFLPLPSQIKGVVILGIAIAWLAFMIYTYFMNGIRVNNDSIQFSPNFMTWLSLVLTDTVILVGLWMVSRRQS